MITETPTETWAEQHSDQWRGCLDCKESHHKTAFCHRCGKCYFKALSCEQCEYLGTIVRCRCGHTDLWD